MEMVDLALYMKLTKVKAITRLPLAIRYRFSTHPFSPLPPYRMKKKKICRLEEGIPTVHRNKVRESLKPIFCVFESDEPDEKALFLLRQKILLCLYQIRSGEKKLFFFFCLTVFPFFGRLFFSKVVSFHFFPSSQLYKLERKMDL